jgi:hypothetical protein
VHYEALNVYEQHSPKILGITQIPNRTYTRAIAIAFQAALQTTIAHHGTMPNNQDAIPISVKFSPQHFIVATTNNPPTIDALALADPVGEFFRILELEFLAKISKRILQLATFSQ